MKKEPIGIVAAIQDRERREEQKQTKLLSCDHIWGLLRLGVKPVEIEGFAGNEEPTGKISFEKVSASVPSEGKKPKFTVPTWPIDPINPFKGTDSDYPWFTQMYVARANKEGVEVDVACIAEVDYSDHEYLELGACFDLYGNEIILTEEEKELELQRWKDWMGKQ